MNRKVKITVIGKRGKRNCPRGHKIGNTFITSGKTPEGLCCTAFNSLWPDVKILIHSQDRRFEGSNCCPDPDVLMEYKLELLD